MLTIVEIIERSRQGVTRPFLCRCTDGYAYYAKGAGVGWKGLVAEWLAGRVGCELGLQLGLLIPRFDLAEVPGALLKKLSRDDQFDLGEHPVFVSRMVPETYEFRYADLDLVPKRTQSNILCFDCWIRNADRTLTHLGGNPNLLWCPDLKQLLTIDHNLAFEADPVSKIIASHVFGSATVHWTDDFRVDWEKRAAKALSQLDSFWEELPEIWVERALEIDREGVRSILSRLPWENDPTSLSP